LIIRKINPLISVSFFLKPVVKPKGMSLEEVRCEHGRASREFYMHKLGTLDDMISYKKEFMIKVKEIIAKNSYLAKAMKSSIS
jgi:anaerobic magnesium-protoporphyrin IX monomethyl ester cyclase